MSEVFVQERDVVIPGEKLAEGMDFLPGENTYRDNAGIYSRVLGIVGLAGRVLKITPIAGPYVPRIGDRIIAKIFDITMSGWRVETNTAYSALLNVRDATTRFIKKEEDLTQILAIGDYVVVNIINVTSQNLIDISMRGPDLGKVEGGRVMSINSMKVPRVIGKQGSMIQLLKEKTGCDITVGQNGLVWLKGTPEGEYKAEQAIKYIEAKSHLEGLTEKVQTFLSQ